MFLKVFIWEYWNIEAFIIDKDLYKDMNRLSEMEMIEEMKKYATDEQLIELGILIPVSNSSSS